MMRRGGRVVRAVGRFPPSSTKFMLFFFFFFVLMAHVNLLLRLWSGREGNLFFGKAQLSRRNLTGTEPLSDQTGAPHTHMNLEQISY